jgi:hypothetical protein
MGWGKDWNDSRMLLEVRRVAGQTAGRKLGEGEKKARVLIQEAIDRNPPPRRCNRGGNLHHARVNFPRLA